MKGETLLFNYIFIYNRFYLHKEKNYFYISYKNGDIIFHSNTHFGMKNKYKIYRIINNSKFKSLMWINGSFYLNYGYLKSISFSEHINYEI